MRQEYQCPGRTFEEYQATTEWQCQPQLQAAAEAGDAKAKEMLAFQNAMFAAAYCRKENGRCEGCGG